MSVRECGVCLEDRNWRQQLNMLSLSPCRHKFDAYCINRWLGTRVNCPNCRSEITSLNLNGQIWDIAHRTEAAAAAAAFGRRTLSLNEIVQSGDMNIIKQALAETPFDARQIWEALIGSVVIGRLDIVQLLLPMSTSSKIMSNEEKLEIWGCQGDALKRASDSGRSDIVQAIFTNFVQVLHGNEVKMYVPDYFIRQALCEASARGDLSLVKAIYKNRRNNEKSTYWNAFGKETFSKALNAASENNQQTILNFFLGKSRVDRDLSIYELEVAIGFSLKNGHFTAAQSLFQFGLRKCSYTRPPSLSRGYDFAAVVIAQASYYGDLNQVQMLCQQLPSLQNIYLSQAIEYASKKGHFDVVLFLLHHGRVSQNNFKPSLSSALKANRFDVVQALFDKGPNPIPDCTWEAKEAIDRGHLDHHCFDIALFLLQNSPVSETNRDLRRGLSVVLAARNGRLNETRTLLQEGPITDAMRELAGWEASERGHFDIVRCLMESGPVSASLWFELANDQERGGRLLFNEMISETRDTHFVESLAMSAIQSNKIHIIKSLLQYNLISNTDRLAYAKVAISKCRIDIALAFLKLRLVFYAAIGIGLAIASSQIYQKFANNER